MNLNKIFLIGRLTRDPELRTTPNGQSVATIGLATSRVWNNQQTGQKQEATEFHTIVAWGRLAEIAGQYLKKGSLAMFEGRLQTRSWDDKNTGAKRYMTEVVAEGLQMGPRPAGAPTGPAPVRDVKPAAAPRSEGDTVPKSSSAGYQDADIPIINENDLSSGVSEGEVSLKGVDLPF